MEMRTHNSYSRYLNIFIHHSMAIIHSWFQYAYLIVDAVASIQSNGFKHMMRQYQWKIKSISKASL